MADTTLIKNLIKAKTSLRKKYKQLQNSETADSDFLNKAFKPIVDPLNELTAIAATGSSKNKSGGDGKDIEKDASKLNKTKSKKSSGKISKTKKRRKMITTKVLQQQQLAPDNEHSTATIKDEEEDDIFHDVTTDDIDKTGDIGYDMQGGDDDDDDDASDAEDVGVGDEQLLLTTPRSLKEPSSSSSSSFPGIVSTNRGSAAADDKLLMNNIPSYATPYVQKFFTGKWTSKKTLDKIYSPKMSSNNKITLGNKSFGFDGRYVYVGAKKFPSTKGLWDLLFLEAPTGYTEEDLKQYAEIVKYTNVAYHGYSKTNHLNTFHSKYKNVLKKIVGRNAAKEGMGVFNKVLPKSAMISYEYWNDPNELVNRLQLLHASSMSGHTGHINEINSILEELKEAGYIY